MGALVHTWHPVIINRKMSMNVSRDEVKFSVKLTVIFSFILPLEIRLNF